jgi:hypothetical protein
MARSLNVACITVGPDGRIGERKSFPRVDFPANAAALPEGWQLKVISRKWQQIDGDTQWFDGVSLSERPHLLETPDVEIAADGVQVFRLSLGPGSVVLYRSQRDERGRFTRTPVDVSDGALEFVTAVAGIYEFEIEPVFPLRTLTLRITAHAV